MRLSRCLLLWYVGVSKQTSDQHLIRMYLSRLSGCNFFQNIFFECIIEGKKRENIYVEQFQVCEGALFI